MMFCNLPAGLIWRIKHADTEFFFHKIKHRDRKVMAKKMALFNQAEVPLLLNLTTTLGFFIILRRLVLVP